MRRPTIDHINVKKKGLQIFAILMARYGHALVYHACPHSLSIQSSVK